MIKQKPTAEELGQQANEFATVDTTQLDAQIAEIDKQIEAEKKRDGKSAESVAKIKAMEKKKTIVVIRPKSDTRNDDSTHTGLNNPHVITYVENFKRAILLLI